MAVWRYFALQDYGDPHPFGVLRFDQATGDIQRWNQGVGWFISPSEADVVVGGEPGAHMITEHAAQELMDSGELVVLSDVEVAYLKGESNEVPWA